MKKILFIAEYPSKYNIKDGMIQRIKAVDNEFKNIKRTYLHFDFKRHLIPSFEKTTNTTIVRLNFFTGILFAIPFLISYKNFYIHSLYNCEKIFWFPLLRFKSISIDVHGVVPEELEFYGKNRRAKWLHKVEKRFFTKAKNIICVSQQMRNYYLSKYPSIKSKFLIKPIVPSNVVIDPDSYLIKNLIKELDISENMTIFIYSGNLQKWQNFELTLDTIRKNDKPEYFYIFLSRETDKIQELLDNCSIPNNRFSIRSVEPELLKDYYALAHYGFILRDNHILNKVACPTKLIEYLFFGITPIVKYEDIGDASLMKYDHISYKDLNGLLKPIKSEKNVSIAKTIINDSINNSILEFINK